MFENSVQEFYLRSAKKTHEERKKYLYSIRTRKQAIAYIKSVQEKIDRIFSLPKTKCNLKTQFTAERKINNITIKNVIYESRKDYPVTAMLMLPEGKGKHPGVLFLCGHSEEGKACETYQRACMNLAQQGFAVLIIDPVSQGERHQMLDVFDRYPYCTNEHNFHGKQLYLTGEFFGSYRAWDAIRGIDLLQSLPEVDAQRIAVTGNSGGGTMSTFVNALDRRLCMAAPSCYITTWRREVENELPADVEQMPPGTLAYGLDMADFIIAQAPRPTLILGQKNDFFDPRGTMEAYEDVRHIYSLLGAEDKIGLFIGPDSHGYHTANREAMYNFFNKHTFASNTHIHENTDIEIMPQKDTFCSPDGEIFKLPQYRKMRELNQDIAAKLISKRRPLNKESLRKKLAANLAIGKITEPYYRKLRPGRQMNGSFEFFSRWGLETEEGIVMAVLKYYSDNWFNYIPDVENAILYIPDRDSDIELISDPEYKKREIFALDIRGTGELIPSGCDRYNRDFLGQYLFDYHFASLGIMYDNPYLGGRVKDILSALELLKNSGVKNITLKAKGLGTIPALISAVLSDIPVATELIGMPDSWASMVNKAVTYWPLSVMSKKILAITDLDELRSFVPNIKFTIADEPDK